MKYRKTITLKDGRSCRLRNVTAEDARPMLDLFRLTHGQTDYLLTYPDEEGPSLEEEAQFLQGLADSDNEIEIVAELEGTIVGNAGIRSMSTKEKLRHRAEFGITIDRSVWGLGLGRALTQACIECARKAGYSQLELDVVAENERACALYRSEGFVEFGRNPRGMRSRTTGWQELVLMRLELDCR